MGVCGPANAGNILLNGGLDTVGPDGSPVSGSGPSAAQSWTQFTVVPGSTISSQLLASTDPLGGGEMIDITTNAGYYAAASQGNGFYQDFATIPAATASFDIFVVSGSVTGGLGLATGPFASFTAYTPTGAWQHVTQTVNAPVDGMFFENLVTGAGAEFLLDNLQVNSIPEPGTFAMMLLAAGSMLLWRVSLARR